VSLTSSPVVTLRNAPAAPFDGAIAAARTCYAPRVIGVDEVTDSQRASVFAKRISHTADSQDQRHRMVPASRPMITFADTREPDVVTPTLIARNTEAKENIYDASMDELEQVRTHHPRLARHIGPPCVVRNGLVSPRCTEGKHFCGVPVWNSFPNVERLL
jgi:hypothetical protein